MKERKVHCAAGTPGQEFMLCYMGKREPSEESIAGC